MKITRGPNQLAQQANDEGGPRHIKHKQNTNDTRQNEKTDKEILVYCFLCIQDKGAPLKTKQGEQFTIHYYW